MRFLADVAEPCQADVEAARPELPETLPDRLSPSDRHDGDALCVEVATLPAGERLDRTLVTDTFDEHGCPRARFNEMLHPRILNAGRCPPRSTWRTIGTMAYDEVLASRIRELVADEPSLTEQRMFGGLAFLIGGNMAFAASGQGGILVRVDPEQTETLVATTSARVMEMRGRQMRGWLRVDADKLEDAAELASWVEHGTSYARSLPAKR